QSFKAIGPYHKGNVVATGLSREEIKILLPTAAGVGLEPEDRTFTQAVTAFYNSILTRVPQDGLRLEVGLENNEAELSNTNMPLNVKDYIIWRHAIGHPDVASSREDALRGYNKRFYVLDPQVTKEVTERINDLEDEAMAIYFKHKDD